MRVLAPELDERAINANVFFDALEGAGAKTASGKVITPGKALEGTIAVYAAVSLRAETVGSLPLLLYRRISDAERERIRGAPLRWPMRLARMLHESPNPEMTAQEYFETVQGHVDLWGNHYSAIVRLGDGRPAELWPLRPDRMEVFRDRDARGLPIGPRRYLYTLDSGQKVRLERHEVMHVRGYGSDGIVGLSPITVARQAIGIEQAAAEFAGRFYRNSAMPGGILVTPGVLSADRLKALKRAWQDAHGGLTRAHRIAVLQGGVEWREVGMPLEDAQFVETRRFQIEEVARLYRIPLHLLGDTTKSTTWGTGIEQMTIGFVVYTIRSSLKRIELAVNRDLRNPELGETLLDEGLFAEFKVDGLLRGDMKTRAEFYQRAITNGWMTRNEVRALENLPPIEGLDDPILPANFAAVSNGNRALDAYELHLRELARLTEGRG